MNALKISVIAAEVAVVASLAVSSYSIAFSGHSSDWGAAAPLAALVAIESMRLPLAFRLPRMRPLGLICGGAMLAGLSVITGEAASLGFTNLIYQRMRPVADAERDLARAQISRDALNSAIARRAEEIARLQADVEAAQKHRASIDQPPTLQPPPAGRTCAGRHGSWNCGAAVQAEAAGQRRRYEGARGRAPRRQRAGEGRRGASGRGCVSAGHRRGGREPGRRQAQGRR
jgi:hypothetical protein